MGLKIINDISDLLLGFPKHERYDFSSKLSRYSVSLPSNMAVGLAKTDKLFSNYHDISLGSLFEQGNQLLVAKHRQYKNEEKIKNLKKK